jgi:hypothetical protein
VAIIDKIGEKISSGASAVSASTKRVTETARINGEISANSAEIEKRMKQLGMCVKARLMSQINDEEALRLAAEIDDFIARNEALAAELEQVKGIRRCEKCGTALPANSMFCPSCGARCGEPAQKVAVKVKTPEVRNTEAVYAANNSYYEQPVPPVPQPAQPEYSEQPEQTYEQPVQNAPQSEGIFCTVCGYRDTSDAIFCSNCGNRLVR